MVKSLAILFGIVFLAIGILGFVHGITKDDMLLGIFMVNPAHSVVHIASGVVALLCGMSGAGASRVYFQIFGIVYALVAILGFVRPDVIFGQHLLDRPQSFLDYGLIVRGAVTPQQIF